MHTSNYFIRFWVTESILDELPGLTEIKNNDGLIDNQDCGFEGKRENIPTVFGN